MLTTLDTIPEVARIDRVQTTIVDLPFRRLQKFARFEARNQSSLLIRINTSCGAEGIGEAIVPCGPWWSGDSIEAMQITIERYLAPALIGQNPYDIDRLMSELGGLVRDNRFAKAGVEMALMDLVGKLLDVPCQVLLGGMRRDACPVAWPIASGDAARDADEIEAMLASGRASAFKVKMGATRIRDDIVRIERLACAIDGRAGLRVDPNESWTEIEALGALSELARIGVELIEQPLERRAIDASARLAAKSPVPIMIDEGVQTEADTIEVVRKHAAHLISLKLMKAGGMRASKRMADIAEAAGIPLYLGTFLETSLGTAAGLHLGAGVGLLPLGGEIIGPMLLAEDIAANPVSYRNGAAQLPEGPGLGIELDEDRVRRFTRA
ncbi:muconate/chloromuconate family cycloisomerase [Paracoccus sp. P2]|uniref:Muconate cycloisomerase/chloromuconate cycloisomerase n=1 Tax=Aquamicrobium lusatiense TaxID=89772 RepID=A0A7W9VXU1_9HYPH|nr:muconate/chloromuconate family cycloisomerase [Aquamicrobium lusatiense]MBB6014537.1 muconate cycloisomerase/chloromuconate cycloisomerase [Aquamicrobium lusatiense]